MLTVETLMKRNLVTVRPHTSVREALTKMAHEGVRHLPVVDEAGRLLGIVAQLDVVRALDLALVAAGARGDLEVRDVMSAPAWRATPRMPAHQAAAILIENKIGSLPVVDGDGYVVGMLTETDFVELAREALSGIAFESRAQS